ncbi:hypothetical protein J7297_02061 [Nakaseomyces glabratus]|nr:hypothetical protein J7297_02061 [Nakaseomyces glabratus]
MKGIFICLWILLLRHTLSADTGVSNDNNIHIFTNDDPKYEHSGDIGSPTIAWYMVDGPNLKEITYNGNVQLDSYFLLKATEGNTGYQFNYHGGSFEVGGGQGIFNELASGPTIVNMQGDSFNGKGTSNYTAGVREGSTIYMDFTNYYTQDSYIENFQSVTYSATTNATIDKYILINTDVYILGPVLFSPTYYDSPVLHKSNIWLDSPDIADISGSNFQFGGEGNSGLYIKDSAATKDKEIKLSDSFLDSNNTIAFDTPIQSLNWLHTGLFPGRSGILVVHTTKNTYNISFSVLGHHYCLTDKNFKITKTDVNHNGTSIEMFQVTYDPTSNVQCPPPYTVTQEYNIIPSNCFVEDIWVISFVGTTSISYIEETMITICKTEDYTTTIDKGNGDFETDLVSHITTKDSNGNPTTIVTTIPLTKPSGEADYTTTIDKGNGDFETDLVSHITTKDSNGNPTTIVTTIIDQAQRRGRLHHDDRQGNGDFETDLADYTTTIDKGNGDFETDLVSHITTKDSNGNPTTIVTTIPLTKPSGEADYTTTIDKGNGDFETDLVSHITTKDSNGNPTTIVTTIPLTKPSGEADYTTTIDKGNGDFETDLVSHITTKDSNGNPTTIVTTIPLTKPAARPTTPRDDKGNGTSSRPPSGEADYTTTIDKGNGDFETDLVSHITTKDSNGNPTTIVTTIPLTKPSGEADYTTTIDKGNGDFETDLVSHITTKDSNGNPTTIVTTIPLTKPSGEADYTTTIDKGNGDFETDLVSHITTKDSNGNPTTIVTTIPLTKPSGEADYTTTIDKGNGDFETDLVSHITTKDSNGNPTTIVTTIPLTKPSGGTIHHDDRQGQGDFETTSPSGEADYTTTIDKGNGDFETDLVSHITTKDSNGNPTTIVTTIPLKPRSRRGRLHPTIDKATATSDRPRLPHHHQGLHGNPTTIVTTIPLTKPAARPTTPRRIDKAPEHFETESCLPHHHQGLQRQPTTIVTTIPLTKPAARPTTPRRSTRATVTSRQTSSPTSPPRTPTATLHTQIHSRPIPPHTTHTTTTKTTPHTQTQPNPPPTPSMTKPSGEADYTTTIDKGNGDFETDLVSHITTKDSNGNPTTIVTTIPLKPSDAGEADYTTTIDKGNGDFETDLVSHITTKDSNGNPTTIVTTIPLTEPSGEADYTTTIDKGNGDFETDLVSHITTKDSNGNPTTIVTTIPLTKPAGGRYNTTIDKGNGDFETDLVSHITTKDSNGNPTTIVTTIPLTKPSGEADYTTTIDKGNGDFETDLVSHITTKDSNGNPTTIVTTIPLTKPAARPTTPRRSTGQRRLRDRPRLPHHHQGLQRQPYHHRHTIPLTKPSGEADYTTTIDKGNGDFETDLVSHITTKDSNGKPTTIVTTIPLKPSDGGEADYTTTIDKGNGDFETDLVSHITTKDSNGNPTTIVTTIPLTKPSGEADYTTTIDKGNGDFETDLVSHITTKDSNGNPTTIVTTIPLTKPSGEADYTTTIDKGNGDFETDLVSHITTKDSNGNPTTSSPPSHDQASRGRLHPTIDRATATSRQTRLPHHHHRLQRQAYHDRHHHPIDQAKRRGRLHHRDHRL